MNYSVRIFITLVLLLIFAQGVRAQSNDWKIKKQEWSDADEKSYSEFVSRLGQAVEKAPDIDLVSFLRR